MASSIVIPAKGSHVRVPSSITITVLFSGSFISGRDRDRDRDLDPECQMYRAIVVTTVSTPYWLSVMNRSTLGCHETRVPWQVGSIEWMSVRARVYEQSLY